MPSVLNEPYFNDEQAAFTELEGIVWPDGPVCPHCGCTGRVRALEGVKDKAGRKRIGLKKCYDCRKQLTVRVGTIFEKSHVPLHIWFQAVYLLCSSKKGISSNQLSRTLGVTLQTAWFMGHRLREAMRTGSLAPMGGAGEIIEIDETFIGRKPGIEVRAGVPTTSTLSSRLLSGVGRRDPSISIVRRRRKFCRLFAPILTAKTTS